MPVSVRQATPADYPAILDLARRSRGEGLTEQERAERGFIQGRFDRAGLDLRIESGGGVLVAIDGGQLAGFVMASLPDTFPPGSGGPAVATIEYVLALGVPRAALFLYGPIAVEPGFQGHGVFRSLVSAVSRMMLDRGRTVGSAFVESVNERSFGVHAHVGMAERGTVTLGDRHYVVFTFDPRAMI